MSEDLFSIMVRRSLDDNPDPGAQNEAAAARRWLRKTLIDNEANRHQPIWFGKQAATVDVMALMNIHNKPLVNEIAKLKKENKEKDKKIEELITGGHVATVLPVVENRQSVSDSEHANLLKQLAGATAENAKLSNQLSVALELVRGATINDLSDAGAKKAPVATRRTRAPVNDDTKERRRGLEVTRARAFREPVLKLIRDHGGKIKATEAKKEILDILPQFGVILTETDLAVGYYEAKPSETLWSNTIQGTINKLKREGILKWPDRDPDAQSGWWELV